MWSSEGMINANLLAGRTLLEAHGMEAGYHDVWPDYGDGWQENKANNRKLYLARYVNNDMFVKVMKSQMIRLFRTSRAVQLWISKT